ncbi:hypothetical protein TB2_043845 [Malus domestica]
MTFSQVFVSCKKQEHREGFKYIYASLALSHIQLIRSSEEYGQELVMSWIKSARAPSLGLKVRSNPSFIASLQHLFTTLLFLAAVI